jgi:preprotein translocase subunit SecG
MLAGLLLLALVFNAVCMILHFLSQRKKEKDMENAKFIVDYKDL